VLMLTREESEAVLDAIEAHHGRTVWEELVVLGSEGATRAVNAPKGMLGVRVVADVEGDEGQRLLALSELGRGNGLGGRWAEKEVESEWGTGVRMGRDGEEWWRDEAAFNDRG
jgi:hypothetical protein